MASPCKGRDRLMTYLDMTFCADTKCQSIECHRHHHHVPIDVDMPVSWSNFLACEKKDYVVVQPVKEDEDVSD